MKKSELIKSGELKARNLWHLEIQQAYKGRISKVEKKIKNKYQCRNNKARSKDEF